MITTANYMRPEQPEPDIIRKLEPDTLYELRELQKQFVPGSDIHNKFEDIIRRLNQPNPN
jgi:hypothetical protein